MHVYSSTYTNICLYVDSSRKKKRIKQATIFFVRTRATITQQQNIRTNILGFVINRITYWGRFLFFFFFFQCGDALFFLSSNAVEKEKKIEDFPSNDFFS